MADDKYITLNDLAEDTGVTRTTLYSHIKRGRLKVKKVGFFTVVHPKDANEFKSHLQKLNLGGRTVTIYQ